MNDMRLFKLAMALTLCALAFLVVKNNLEQSPSQPIPTNQIVSSGKSIHLQVTGPDPRLTPVDVVRAQLDALRKNDENDSGIRLAFRLASPRNQQATGPIDRFITIVKSPDYAPMFTFAEARYGKPMLRDIFAQQPVTLISEDGTETHYIFLLMLQQSPPVASCWMTDGVIQVDEEGNPLLPTPPDKESVRI